MIPVDQTQFGYPDGDCLAACVASITEVPREEVPTFKESPGWFVNLRDWCFAHGWLLWYERHADMKRAPKGYHMMCGPSPRRVPCGEHRAVGLDASCAACAQGEFIAHATVALDGVIVHDPNPSRAGLLEVEDWLLLYPLCPTRKVVRKLPGR